MGREVVGLRGGLLGGLSGCLASWVGGCLGKSLSDAILCKQIRDHSMVMQRQRGCSGHSYLHVHMHSGMRIGNFVSSTVACRPLTNQPLAADCLAGLLSGWLTGWLANR